MFKPNCSFLLRHVLLLKIVAMKCVYIYTETAFNMYRDRISNRFERLNNFIIVLILFADGGFDNIIYLFPRFILDLNSAPIVP